MLSQLEALNNRQARIVEYRISGGLTLPEIAGVLGVSLTTVEKDWRRPRVARRRAWLMRPWLFAACFGIGCSQAAAPQPPPTAAHALPLTLSLIGDVDLARDLAIEGHPIGGISGLAYSATTRTLLALSDAHGEKGPARMYELELGVSPVTLTPRAVTLLQGPFASAHEDPEAIALLPTGEVLIASEGDLEREPPLPPSVQRMSRAGAHLGTMELPPELTRRTQVNKAIEGLAVSPSGKRIVVTTEHPLAGDDVTHLYVFDGAMSLVGQLPYRIDPVPTDPRPGEVTRADIGISELLLLDDDTLFVMERASVAIDEVFANYVRIYRVSLAAHVSAAVDKHLVIDLSSVAERLTTPALDNFEAMTLGPRLLDGRRTLVIASDDNFKTTQRTVFVVFAISG